jgi:hypothetical protein
MFRRKKKHAATPTSYKCTYGENHFFVQNKTIPQDKKKATTRTRVSLLVNKYLSITHGGFRDTGPIYNSWGYEGHGSPT